jgi:hypothetical protein
MMIYKNKEKQIPKMCHEIKKKLNSRVMFPTHVSDHCCRCWFLYMVIESVALDLISPCSRSMHQSGAVLQTKQTSTILYDY